MMTIDDLLARLNKLGDRVNIVVDNFTTSTHVVADIYTKHAYYRVSANSSEINLMRRIKLPSGNYAKIHSVMRGSLSEMNWSSILATILSRELEPVPLLSTHILTGNDGTTTMRGVRV